MKLDWSRGLIGSLAVTVVLCAVSCDVAVDRQDGSSATDGGNGTLRILVTDKPFPFEFIDEALVTITRVEVRRADEAGDDDEDGAFDEEEDIDEEGSDDGLEDDDEANDEDDAEDQADSGGDDEEQSETAPEVRDMHGEDVGDDVPDDGADDDAGNDGLDDDGGEEDVAENDAGDDLGDGDAEADDADAEDGDESDDGEADDEGEDEDEDDSPFIVIFEGERDFNLLDLQNGRTELLVEAQIPAGVYTQVRLIVSEGQITLNDETQRIFRLKVPSGSRSGIKLRTRFEVSADEETRLLLDVDLSRAFTPIPGGMIEDASAIQSFKFQPSLAMRLMEVEEAGSISGIGTDGQMIPLSDVTVTAYVDGEEVASTLTEADGSYMFTGLPAGVYQLEFSATGLEAVIIEDAVVETGQATEFVDAVMISFVGEGGAPGNGEGGPEPEGAYGGEEDELADEGDSQGG